MAKLTGTDPDQVPTNADLGTMAYQDAERPALGQTNVKSAGTALIVERTGDATNLQFKADGQNVGHIYGFKNGSGGDRAFYPTNSSGVITQRMKIDRDGDVSIIDGNVVLANGHGIDFSATSNGSGTTSSELLDDYEEGTWTPVDASGAGLTFGTINTPSYTKIGRLCYVFAYVSYPATSSTSTQSISGLPFTARTGSYYAQLTVRVTSNSVSSQNLTFQVTDGSNSAIIHEGAGALTNADMSGNAFLISGVYETA